MTAITFSPLTALTPAQVFRVWEIWHDPTTPTEYIYQLEGDQVVGRAALHQHALGKQVRFGEVQRPPMPTSTVTSSRVDPKPIATRDVLHEQPPAMRNARGAEGARGQRAVRKPAPTSKPKPRRSSPYTRADMFRGLFWIAVLLTVWISTYH